MPTGLPAFGLSLWNLLFVLLFAGGSALLWIPLLGKIRVGRASRLALMLEALRRSERRRQRLGTDGPALSGKERAYLEKARLAGLPVAWSWRRFRLLQTGLAAVFLLGGTAARPPSTVPFEEWTAGAWLLLLIQLLFCLSAGWWTPMLLVLAAAGQKKTQYMLEIAKLSQRLSVCVSDQADLRDMLLRAGRPLKLLRPHLQELTVLWAKDRHEAIARFRDGVGITEIYPLVNALEAISMAEAKEVAQVLKEQTAGIEATLASDINRKLENAPIWISFYIMIPFAMIVMLFLYPWIVTISQQLMTSFQG